MQLTINDLRGEVMFTGKDGYRFGDHMGAMLAKVETGVKNLGEKISGKAKAADAQAVQGSTVLAATLVLAKEAHASGVKQRLSATALHAVAQFIEVLNAATDSGSYVKFEAEGQRQAAADSALGLRSSEGPLNCGSSSSSGCFQLKSSQQQLFIHPEGGVASIGSRLILHKGGPEARLCFRFVLGAPGVTAPAGSSRSRSPSPRDGHSGSESSPPPSLLAAGASHARDAGHAAENDTAACTSDIIGRLQHVESGLFVAPSAATLPSSLILIADPSSSASFAMTSAGHLLHVASAAVVCPAKASVASGCALSLRPQDSTVLEHSSFSMHPFESYSNGHLILQSLFLTICRKFRKYARTLSSCTFIDPKCVKRMQQSSQVPYKRFCFLIQTLHDACVAVCHLPTRGRELAACVP